MVSMLARLIPRKKAVAADPIEYEYRDAEYEYEYVTTGGSTKPRRQGRIERFWLSCVDAG
jgi:hypothetical protein